MQEDHAAASPNAQGHPPAASQDASPSASASALDKVREREKKQEGFAETMEGLHVALAGGKLGEAVKMSMRLIEMVGEEEENAGKGNGDGGEEDEEEGDEEVSMELADACYEKVTPFPFPVPPFLPPLPFCPFWFKKPHCTRVDSRGVMKEAVGNHV
jgi:hypothetical protein